MDEKTKEMMEKARDKALGQLQKEENKKIWEERYGNYITKITSHLDNATQAYKAFNKRKGFTFSTSTGELKDHVYVFSFSMRYLGQEIAKVKVNSKEATRTLIVTKDHLNGIKDHFSSIFDEVKKVMKTMTAEKLGENGEYYHCHWEDETASKFCNLFTEKATEKTSKSKEHTLESSLITALSQSKNKEEKLLANIQPIKFSSLRFPMTTPLTASKDVKNIEFSNGVGGGIDILARYRRGNTSNLCVTELKDEYESPEKPLAQAVAYATFVQQLLWSDIAKGEEWYHFFGFNANKPVSKPLTINVVVAMPHNPKGESDISFAGEKIDLGDGDKLVLHYMYLDIDENYTIKKIDTSLNKSTEKTVQSDVETEEQTSFLKIHRGTDQIGGTVTEIKSGDDRIFIDFGSQLQGAENITTLEIDGLTKGTANATLLLTHYHGDHMGEIHRILDDVPVYLGEVATEISKTLCETLIEANISEKSEQEKKLDVLKRTNHYKNGVSFDVGAITITPYRVDHSAFDSYMLLIECEGKRILHTGDFRFHGFRSDEMWDAFEQIGEVDYLITEGTTMSRDTLPENTLSEDDYVKKMQDIFAEHEKVAVLCSSTNIDHIASIQQALPEDKIILCDEYQKSILDVVTDRQPNENTAMSKLYSFDEDKIGVLGTDFKDKIKEKGYCVLIRAGKQPYFITNPDKNKGIHLVYSQWTGYLSGSKHSDPKIVALEEMYSDRMSKLHTSGHVYKEDLAKMIDILHPEKGIIPIHTENPEGFEAICDKSMLKCLKDGEELKLN